jgi:hypothetical protein
MLFTTPDLTDSAVADVFVSPGGRVDIPGLFVRCKAVPPPHLLPVSEVPPQIASAPRHYWRQSSRGGGLAGSLEAVSGFEFQKATANFLLQMNAEQR